MKTTKIFKAFALSTLLLAGGTGVALAGNDLVSGEPYQGFFQGVDVPANGPVIITQVATEAPGNLVTVEGRTILDNSNVDLASLTPEAIIGLGLAETDEDAEEVISIAMAK